ncbi:CpsD/CapB family tyrosine-protein kinase [Roseovarius sp. A21]|uniref:CpsD/CapB family tyrosine-protein kinase n=1 Tax=Roseovarius bejariae TaxID=2576383 RepID=A0A844D098_9RHOB|nr:CpsD/CapB family tyrosine-protein kinase [Roseovarius bejariae]MRU15664.1 CpsD/CapB family tyrosine-protein kinase [Roseovarius bejariae]
MEKLQAALDKARRSRNERNASSETNPVTPKIQDNTSASLIARWQALTPFEVQDKHLIRHRVVTRSARKAATPFDILRTKALLQMRQNGWKRVAITSPMPKSGKSTMACNLALGLGRQNDLRSMLFDLDLRDPSVQNFFETRPPHGISEMLSGAVPFEEQALRYGENVAVSMAQRAEADPTRILLAEETAEKLDEIQATYEPDVMIFDLPSVLVNDDSRAFLKNADCALIVVRADATHYGQFETCQREVAEHTNVLGVVLNAYRHDKRAVETA